MLGEVGGDREEVEKTLACGGGGSAGGGGGFVSNMNIGMNIGNFKMKEERVPQWSHQETRDFIATRAELERDFALTKRNKTLWEGVANKMKEMGYKRTPDQCKCKWKNLVKRYKVCITLLWMPIFRFLVQYMCSCTAHVANVEIQYHVTV